MEYTNLIPVASLENAWARLSGNPEYQRSVTTFFKAPTFYVGCPGLFAGTSKASGRRAVFCDQSCSQRLARELVARVGAMLESPAPPPDPPTESIDDAQPLNLQNENEVKALFKDFKRAARYQKQSRQLAAAQALLINARRWTEPFHATVSLAAAAATEATAEAACSAGLTSAGANLVGATVAQEPCIRGGGGGSGADGQCTAGVSGRGQMPPAVFRSHPLTGSDDDGDAGGIDGSGASTNRWGGGSVPAAAAVAAAAQSLRPYDATHWATATATVEPPSAAAAAAAAATAATAGMDTTPLRALRVTAGTDPWANLDDSGLHPPGWSTIASSSCSSMAPSTSVTPCWPPATPRSALVPGGGGASARRNPACESESEHCAASPSAQYAGAADAAGAADCDAAAGGSSAGGADGLLVVFCCIDLEWWERDSSRVTEVGWTLWDNLTRRLESRHHIVAEHEALVNRIHVPDHKHEFLFGASSTGSLAEGAAALQGDMDHYGVRVWAQWCGERWQQEDQEGPLALGSAVANRLGSRGEARRSEAAPTSVPPCPRVHLVVVGHGLSQDLRALSSLLGVVLPSGASILDTADLAWAALGGGVGQERTAMSLRVLLKTLDIAATKLHNGGNDARYTMEAMLALVDVESSSIAQ